MTIPTLLPLADRSGEVTWPLLTAVEKLAERLRDDVVEREAAGALPTAEVGLLKESGLLRDVVPVAFGGGGTTIEQLLTAVRVLARVDGSVASLYGYHAQRVNSITLAAGLSEDPELGKRREDLLRETAANNWYWAATGSAQDAEFVLTPTGEGRWTVSGGKGFATGAAVADRLVSAGVVEGDSRVLRFAIDPSRPGINFGGDWDNLGQRLTASGGIELQGYEVRDEDVFGAFPFTSSAETPNPIASFERDPQAALIVPAFQLIFVQLYIGLAEGALSEAAGYVREGSRRWVHAVSEGPTDDPYILRHFGESVSQLLAASTLADRATEQLSYGLERGADLSYEERGQIAEFIAAAKVISTQAALSTTARVFEATGARATKRALGLDRFWREARTHTLHDPVEYKIREVGEAFLNGHLPEPSHYR